MEIDFNVAAEVLTSIRYPELAPRLSPISLN